MNAAMAADKTAKIHRARQITPQRKELFLYGAKLVC
jgi:hypothetical protein